MIRYADLFCGLGAFHTAFSKSKRFTCVLACDIDSGVRSTYAANYGIQPEGDIRTLTHLPDFDLLCAGFPCQPFSIAGNGQGFGDTEKGNLFYTILAIVDAKQPSMCILENVKNLETHDGGRTFQTIRTELEARGYQISWKVLNATDYGSPQARQRIFIVASKRPFSIPEPTESRMTVSDILDTPNVGIDMAKYVLVKKTSTQTKTTKPRIVYDIQSKTTGKGGRQGERVYDIRHAGITVCASSGGPGAKTGLYDVDSTIRRLTVKETLRMFGFPDTYRFPSTVTDEEALFYLGNSIVVNVVDAFRSPLEEYFEQWH